MKIRVKRPRRSLRSVWYGIMTPSSGLRGMLGYPLASWDKPKHAEEEGEGGDEEEEDALEIPITKPAIGKTTKPDRKRKAITESSKEPKKKTMCKIVEAPRRKRQFFADSTLAAKKANVPLWT